MLTECSTSNDLCDPFRLEEDVQVGFNTFLESFILWNLRFTPEKTLKTMKLVNWVTRNWASVFLLSKLAFFDTLGGPFRHLVSL